jgi:hypothetical protein
MLESEKAPLDGTTFPLSPKLWAGHGTSDGLATAAMLGEQAPPCGEHLEPSAPFMAFPQNGVLSKLGATQSASSHVAPSAAVPGKDSLARISARSMPASHGAQARPLAAFG